MAETGSAPPKATITLRSTIEYAAWLGRLAAWCRSNVADLIDKATVAYAKSVGFDEPPPLRKTKG